MRDLAKIAAGYQYFFVAGAGKDAKRLIEFRDRKILPFRIDGFVVSDAGKNPKELGGIAVYGMADFPFDKRNMAILVSVGNRYIWNGIVQNLIDSGFKNIYSIEGEEWNDWIRKSRIQDLTTIDREGIPVERAYGEKNAVYLEYPQEHGNPKRMRIYEDRIWHLQERQEEIAPGWSMLQEFEQLYGKIRLLSDELKTVSEDEKEKDRTCRIYMSRSHADSVITEDEPEPWVVPIQAGAAMTDRRICEIRDDSGDNISSLNADFCECTALYWCWKNDCDYDYIGLCHYRRRIVIPDGDINAVMSTGADLILTTPLYTSMMLRDNFEYMLLPGDWDVVERSLSKHFPDYVASWKKLQQARCYPACNIGLFKHDVFEEYCNFAFSVMKDVNSYYESRNFIRKNRFAGFVMELLLALYALHNQKRYKILYTDFDFYR